MSAEEKKVFLLFLRRKFNLSLKWGNFDRKTLSWGQHKISQSTKKADQSASARRKMSTRLQLSALNKNISENKIQLDLSFLLSSWIKFNFQCIFLLDGSTFFDKNWNLSSMLLLLLKDHFLFRGKNFFNLFKKELFKKTLLLHTGGEEVFEQFFFSNNFCK